MDISSTLLAHLSTSVSQCLSHTHTHTHTHHMITHAFLPRTSPFPPDTSILPTSSSSLVRIRSQVLAPLSTAMLMTEQGTQRLCPSAQFTASKLGFPGQGEHHNAVSQAAVRASHSSVTCFSFYPHQCSPWCTITSFYDIKSCYSPAQNSVTPPHCT